MDKTKKAQELAHQIDEVDVVRYLTENPYFFLRNAQLLEQLKVPHVVREAISLPELVDMGFSSGCSKAVISPKAR